MSRSIVDQAKALERKVYSENQHLKDKFNYFGRDVLQIYEHFAHMFPALQKKSRRNSIHQQEGLGQEYFSNQPKLTLPDQYSLVEPKDYSQGIPPWDDLGKFYQILSNAYSAQNRGGLDYFPKKSIGRNMIPEMEAETRNLGEKDFNYQIPEYPIANGLGDRVSRKRIQSVASTV